MTQGPGMGELKRAAQQLGVASTVLRQQGWKTASDARIGELTPEQVRARIERERESARAAGLYRAAQLVRRALGGDSG
jgi:hypothetical protein